MINFAEGKFSPKAIDFLQNSNARLNILHGSVRSSKTVNCTLRWLTYLFDGPPGDLLMSSKTVATLQRNVLNDLFDIVGTKNYKWINKQQGELKLFNRRVHVMGANNEDAEGKIRGATFAGAYCDEISTCPRSFLDMLLTRLSIRGAKAFMNCNPDDPDHWFYQDFILNDKISNKKVWHFTLDDNPNLDAEYRQALEESFQGVFYERMILGLWTVAEGIIYRKFAENLDDYVITEPPKDMLFSTIAVDFGGNGSGTAFNHTAICNGFREVVTLDDYWTNEELDANDLAAAFVNFVRKQKMAYPRLQIAEVRCDSEATVLIRTFKNALLKAHLYIPVKNAIKGQILDRINFYSLIIGRKAYKILDHCQPTIDALKKCRWHPEKKNVRLDDNTTNIDNLDALEYSTEPYHKRINDMLMFTQSGGRATNAS